MPSLDRIGPTGDKFYRIGGWYRKNSNQHKTGEIIECSDRPHHLSTIPLKNFHLFKIAELIINFYLKKKNLTKNFKQVEVF